MAMGVAPVIIHFFIGFQLVGYPHGELEAPKNVIKHESKPNGDSTGKHLGTWADQPAAEVRVDHVALPFAAALWCSLDHLDIHGPCFRKICQKGLVDLRQAQMWNVVFFWCVFYKQIDLLTVCMRYIWFYTFLHPPNEDRCGFHLSKTCHCSVQGKPASFFHIFVVLLENQDRDLLITSMIRLPSDPNKHNMNIIWTLIWI